MGYENNDLEVFNTLDGDSTVINNDSANLDNIDNINKTDNTSNDINDDNNVDNVDLDPRTKVIYQALKYRGFDPENIKIDEDGVPVVVPFDELSEEEQLQLLNYSPDDPDLDDDEIDLLTFKRENELSKEDLIEYYKRKGIEEYLANEGAVFDVDSLSDEELYAMQIKSEFEDLTDEEIAEEIARAKENETLFKKKIDKIREIKKEEERQALEAQNTPSEDEIMKQEEAKEVIKQSASKLKTIGGFDLEDEDINKSIDYIFKPTITGASKLAMDFNDPEQLFKMAFYMTHGEDLIEAIHEQYTSVLNDPKYLQERLDKLNKKSKKSSLNVSKSNTNANNSKVLDALLKLKK